MCLSGSDRKARRTCDDHRLDRRQTDDRHIKTHVLVGLATLTTVSFPFASSPARFMVASVPSIASIATQAFARTTMVWPRSRRAISDAIFNP
jgi:hypothetical protein